VPAIGDIESGANRLCAHCGPLAISPIAGIKACYFKEISMADMEMFVRGINTGQCIKIRTMKDISFSEIKVSVLDNGNGMNCVIGPAEAIALADALIGAAKYAASGGRKR
jgi:hypothetical protein